jgi:hypothetical protein
MTPTDTNTLRKSRPSGLWAALASEVNRSAAGSVLAGSFGSGQPISVFVPSAGMFDYPDDLAIPVDPRELMRTEAPELICA